MQLYWHQYGWDTSSLMWSWVIGKALKTSLFEVCHILDDKPFLLAMIQGYEKFKMQT